MGPVLWAAELRLGVRVPPDLTPYLVVAATLFAVGLAVLLVAVARTRAPTI
jgi:hypothetical protein